jgi:hypothetical protein
MKDERSAVSYQLSAISEESPQAVPFIKSVLGEISLPLIYG